MALEIVARLVDLPVNGTLAIEHRGEKIVLARSEMGVFAVENQCSHALQELHGGKVRKVFIFCPLHGVRFDLRNGCPSGNLTDKPIKAWHCEVLGEEIAIDLDRRLDPGAFRG
jgi:3-phenylpropionate/trans-cinnamate dioxygenase ferredoxin subunit